MLNSLSLMGKLMQSQALLLHLNTFLPAPADYGRSEALPAAAGYFTARLA